jgi:acyl-CoA synthetase (AMP-forming)/AMP-acid ligase II
MMQKIPEQVEVVTEMPRAGTGKIVKRTLQERFSAPL